MQNQRATVEREAIAPTGRGRRMGAILAVVAIVLAAAAAGALALSRSRGPFGT